MKSLTLVIISCASTLAFGQSISSVTPAEATRSGRIVIEGTGFGAQQGQIQLTGGDAHIASWTDVKIVAYVPESAHLGQNQIRVIGSAGASNIAPFGVTNRRLGGGPVRWTFAASAPRVDVRPERGPDGTIYVGDLNGTLYALTRAGALRWLVKNAAGDGAISVDADGNIYCGGDFVIRSFDKNGALRWAFNHGAELDAGPNVGPDGRIYAAARGGYGAMILSPSGKLLWNDTRVTRANNSGSTGNRVSFAGGNWSFVIVPGYYDSTSTTWSFSQGGSLAWSQPQGLSSTAGSQDGSTVVTVSVNNNQLNSFWQNGNLKWSVPFSTVGKATNAPVVASNGNVFLINQRSFVHALNSNGVSQWNRQISFNFDHSCTLGARPDGKRIIAGSSPSLGQNSVVVNFDATGTQMWRQELPLIGDAPIILTSEFGFSHDQSLAIVGTSHNEYALDQVAYVYAFDTSLPRGTTTSR